MSIPSELRSLYQKNKSQKASTLNQVERLQERWYGSSISWICIQSRWEINTLFIYKAHYIMSCRQ